MTFTIRPLQDDEYERAAALTTRIDPRRRDTAGAWRREDADRASAPVPMRRWAAVDDASGEMIGYASAWHMRKGKHRMDLGVAPGFRRQGIGDALLRTIIDALVASDAATVQARASDEDGDSLRFYERRGFVEIHRVRELWMDPRTADLSPFDDLPVRLEAEGIRFVTFADAAADAEFWSKMTDLQNDVLRDWPDPDPDPELEPTSEAEVRRFFEWSWLIPDASFIAVAGGELVGYSGLGGGDREEARIESGPTAVRTDFRGRGLATALKVLAVREARRLGFTRVRAQSANPAMIRVGEKIGFVPGIAEVRLLRRLGSSASEGQTAPGVLEPARRATPSS